VRLHLPGEKNGGRRERLWLASRLGQSATQPRGSRSNPWEKEGCSRWPHGNRCARGPGEEEGDWEGGEGEERGGAGGEEEGRRGRGRRRRLGQGRSAPLPWRGKRPGKGAVYGVLAAQGARGGSGEKSRTNLNRKGPLIGGDQPPRSSATESSGTGEIGFTPLPGA
jgi:hypothetical protein